MGFWVCGGLVILVDVDVDVDVEIFIFLPFFFLLLLVRVSYREGWIDRRWVGLECMEGGKEGRKEGKREVGKERYAEWGMGCSCRVCPLSILSIYLYSDLLSGTERL